MRLCANPYLKREVFPGSKICPSDPLNFYACWTIGSASFVGTARSVEFDSSYALADGPRIIYDNVTLGSATPVPEPSTYGLLLAGLVALAGLAKRRGRLV